MQQACFVRCNAGGMKILSAVATDPAIRLDLKEHEPGSVYAVKATFPAGYVTPTTGQTFILVKTNLPASPLVRIPVVVRRSRGPVRPGWQMQAQSMIGKPLPAITVDHCREPRKLEVKPDPGRVTALVFAAHFCEHCDHYMPIIEGVARDYQAKGVTFIGIGAGTGTDQYVNEAAERWGTDWIIGRDAEVKVASEFGIKAYPVIFLIGPEGTVEAVHGRYANRSSDNGLDHIETMLRTELDALLAGHTRAAFPDWETVFAQATTRPAGAANPRPAQPVLEVDREIRVRPGKAAEQASCRVVVRNPGLQRARLGKLREFTQALHGSKGTAGRIAAVQLDTLKGDMVILESVTEGLQISFGKVLSPMLRTVTQYAAKLTGALSQWIARNTQLVRTGAIIVAGVGALGAGLLSLSLAATLGAKAFGGLSLITGTVARGIGLVGTLLTSLLSPVGLTIAAVAALGTAILVYTDAGGQALAWLSDRFGALQRFVRGVIDGIAGALAAGDVNLAARILWLGLKQAWEEGVGALSRAWLKGKRFLLTQFYELWSGAQSAAETFWHDLKAGWIETTAFLSSAWQRFTSFIELSWETIKNVATKAWAHIEGLFDETFDVQAAGVIADQALVEAEQRIQGERDAALKEIETQRQGKREQEQQVHEETLRGINEAEDASVAQLDATTNARVADTQQQLADARRELDVALAAVKGEEKALPGADGKEQPGGPKDPLAGLADQLAGMGDVLGAKMGVVGTFNASAAFGLGGSAQERTAKATEETAKNTAKLVANAGKGLVFG
jgi:thiol-disulfide isomerase/thioredoxin